jgi:hypothetical protein
MPKQKSKHDKRERINAVTQALFSEQGYHGTSMEMIIAIAGSSNYICIFDQEGEPHRTSHQK